MLKIERKASAGICEASNFLRPIHKMRLQKQLWLIVKSGYSENCHNPLETAEGGCPSFSLGE